MNTDIIYKISFEKPFTHYCEVEISATLPERENNSSLIFSMPVWTPGSYLIREYQRNVEQVKAYGNNEIPLQVVKINKNSWEVDTHNQWEVTFRYKVYCNEIGVRSCEINADHAFLTGAGVFMNIKGTRNNKCFLKIKLPERWEKISTGLTKISENYFSAENFDELIDCPLEIGNHKVLEFEVQDIRHSICIFGEGNYDEAIITNDIKKIVEKQVEFFDRIPYKDYTFLIRLLDKGRGGLEHSNSFAIHVMRWSFNDDLLYKRFLGLVSHEFFHLWNCKRIKPIEFCPYDYNQENYTRSLWVSEGWTSYFDNLLLRRCGLFNNEDYFSFLEREVNDVLKYQGRSVQSLEESSFDTWIKYYRKDENYKNAHISYYTKGALVALMLNLEIIKSTTGKHSLDDVIKELYKDYKNNKSSGFSTVRLKEVCENISGTNLDGFWERYVRGKDELPLNDYLQYAGLKIENVNAEDYISLDIETVVENEKLMISKVFAGGSGYESGLNTNDEIILLNGKKILNEGLEKRLQDFTIGNVISITVIRDGSLLNVGIKLLPALPNYKIIEDEDKTDSQEKNLNKWLER